MRRYIVEIDEERNLLDVYQTLPEPGIEHDQCHLGRDTTDKLMVIVFLAHTLKILDLPPDKEDELRKF